MTKIGCEVAQKVTCGMLGGKGGCVKAYCVFKIITLGVGHFHTRDKEKELRQMTLITWAK